MYQRITVYCSIRCSYGTKKRGAIWYNSFSLFTPSFYTSLSHTNSYGSFTPPLSPFTPSLSPFYRLVTGCKRPFFIFFGVLHLLSLLLHLLSLPFTGCKRPGYTLIRIPDDHDEDSNPRPQEQSTVEGVLII